MGESCFSCHSLLLNHFALRCKLLRTKSLYEVSVELMTLTDNCVIFSIRKKMDEVDLNCLSDIGLYFAI